MGTILLGKEGINLIIAGSNEAADKFKLALREYPEFSDIEFKESISDFIPFSKMVIKVRDEIVTMGVESIDPKNKSAPRITPQELKKWYDEGKKFVILDTRNDYEFQLGSFDNAIDPDLSCFRAFPDYVDSLSEDLKDKTIVTFCTGGIRCEKAAPLMVEKGFKDVYQLDGGILKYFEECGGEHYHGECFVFDDRIAIDAELNKTNTVLCDVCQYPVTEEQQQSAQYVPERTCPTCIDIR